MLFAISSFVNDSDNFLLKIDSFARLKKLVRTFFFGKLIAFFAYSSPPADTEQLRRQPGCGALETLK
jgi:hypothetical protein